MYTRIYRYKVQADKKEEFLDVHQEMSDYILDSMGGKIQYMRNMNDDTEWIVIEQMESRELYEQRSQGVQDEIAETDLNDRLAELLIAPAEKIQPQEFFVYMEVSAED